MAEGFEALRGNPRERGTEEGLPGPSRNHSAGHKGGPGRGWADKGNTKLVTERCSCSMNNSSNDRTYTYSMSYPALSELHVSSRGMLSITVFFIFYSPHFTTEETSK